MVQTAATLPRCFVRLLALAAVILVVAPLSGADRTTLLVPLPSQQTVEEPPEGVFADHAFGDEASDGWKAYVRLWIAHHQDPANPAIRRFLGLPGESAFEMSARRGKSAPRWLGWRAGSYAQVDTRHFVIYSQAKEAPSRRLAADLERCYWVWTQMFFPLWEATAQVSTALSDLTAEQSIADFLADSPSRITIRRKLRVVLFRDASEYRKTLAPRHPGIERSTGFYDNVNRTICLYVDERDDAATRRHELVHQLFREATRSNLRQNTPGEEEGFWLIEGIAGYFESLLFTDHRATVGGWDASRLQFARYRILAGGDTMPMRELQADGRLVAQQRPDLPRWYAHAIARTHQLIDGGDSKTRQWVYQRLAAHYKINCDLPKVADDGALRGVDLTLPRFLAIDDAHLRDNPVDRPPQQLVLVGCEVTDDGLRSIPPSVSLDWLDLARLRTVRNETVRWLAPNPQSLTQLTLEVTGIDSDLGDWIGKATDLREVDLSFTRVGDSVIDAIAGAKSLSVLWMTGTDVSDRSLDVIARMRVLKSVDLQRTKVTDAGIARLRKARPNLQINPLVLK